MSSQLISQRQMSLSLLFPNTFRFFTNILVTSAGTSPFTL